MTNLSEVITITSDSWYTSMTDDDERAGVTYSGSALSQLLSSGTYDEGAAGSYDVGMATIASLTGQLQTANDDIFALNSQLAIANTLNATLTGQVGSLERDLGSANTNWMLAVDQRDDAISSRDHYQTLYTEANARPTDSRPGTIFDTLEKHTYDVIDDKTTLLIATLAGVGAAIAIQTVRPGVKSGVGAGMAGVIGGVVVAEALETAWDNFKDAAIPWPLSVIL